MKRINYNLDFTELIDDLLTEIRKLIRSKYSWASIMNGYETGTNNNYYNGFTTVHKSYPVMFKVNIANEWMFSPWNGAPINSTGDWDSDDVSGRVIFAETSTITLSMQLERLDVGKLNGFQTEAEEFSKIKPVSFEYKFKQKDADRRKFTKPDIKKVVREIDKLLPGFLNNIEEAIKLQAARRFDELMLVDEEVAMKYLPEDVKDIFIF